jgi:hypothetical protein
MRNAHYEVFDASSFFQSSSRIFIPPDEICFMAVLALPAEVCEAILGIFFPHVDNGGELSEQETADASILAALIWTAKEIPCYFSEFPKKIGFPQRILRDWHRLEAVESGTPTADELKQMFGG